MSERKVRMAHDTIISEVAGVELIFFSETRIHTHTHTTLLRIHTVFSIYLSLCGPHFVGQYVIDEIRLRAVVLHLREIDKNNDNFRSRCNSTCAPRRARWCS